MNKALLILATLVWFVCGCSQMIPENFNQEEETAIPVRRTYRDDGTLQALVEYKDSLRHGIARNYYRNGNVQLEMTYVEGVRHGDAIMYYEKGGIYQITPFVNGERSGIQRKFYENGALMAEIPYSGNEQDTGIKEYTREGKMISKKSEIVFRLVDKTESDDCVELFYQLSDGWQQVQFTRHFPSDPARSYYIATEKGVASDEFPVFPGRSLNMTVHIMAERYTRLGNKEIIKGSYKLSVDRKPQL
jgi:uncharacterized protein YkuJ